MLNANIRLMEGCQNTCILHFVDIHRYQYNLYKCISEYFNIFQYISNAEKVKICTMLFMLFSLFIYPSKGKRGWKKGERI